MSDKQTVPLAKLLVGAMLGVAFVLICIAVWMIVQNEGAPVFVAVAGAMLAAFASIIAAQTGKKR